MFNKSKNERISLTCKMHSKGVSWGVLDFNRSRRTFVGLNSPITCQGKLTEPTKLTRLEAIASRLEAIRMKAMAN